MSDEAKSAAADASNKFLYWVLASGISFVTAVVVIANGMIDARIRQLELYGSPALRERVIKIETDYNYLKLQLQEIQDNQRKIMELLEKLVLDKSERDKRMKTRAPVAQDQEQIIKIYHSFYERDFPLDLSKAMAAVVAEKNERVLGFGWLELSVEATVILDLQARPREKFEALRQIIAYGENIASNAGFNQMHVFPKDDKFTNILKKHLNFSDITGDCLVKNLG